jgi:hypothetical protein
MKKIIFSVVLTSFCLLTKAQSPITLGNSNMPASGDTLRYSNAQLNSIGNYTQTGANFTWNYSTLTPTSQGIRSFKTAFLTPYAFFFIGLNEYGEKIADTLGAGPLTMTNYYNYYKKQTSPFAAYIADGAGITFSAIPVPNYYTDKDELYKFPMSYPQYDSTTFKFSTVSSTLIPIVYSKTGYRVTKVDGWGNITTPFGTIACLRILTTQYSQDSIKNNIIPFPVGFPNNQRSYQWLTSTTKIPFLEVSGNLVGNNFTPTQIRYRDMARTIVRVEELSALDQMNFYPNPVKDELVFDNGNSKVNEIQIFSITGSLLKKIEVEVEAGKSVKLDLSALQSGLYTVELIGKESKNSFKIIKE